ncbi:2-phosphosulfolactate phosphatase [Thermophagus sp. OGC60D27]|uniref:2-phosphosulfolactate phosphatase n=1 Tax=Thermophagus sp. OGC60D27 TaxID=3458415 RepID=UPI004037DA0A
MNIDVIFSYSEVSANRIAGRTVVVIDVLRATSLMVTALNNGASKVVPVLTPEEAFHYRELHPENVLLVGERSANPIEGFDYGNSPLEMSSLVVENHILVMTTTNGTRAIRAAEAANDLFIAAFLNARSTAKVLENFDEVTLIASGSNGSFTMEDTLCAGYIIDIVQSQMGKSLFLSDAALGAHQLFIHARNDLHGMASLGRHYQLLKSKGLEDDLSYCFRKDCIDLICFRENGSIFAGKQ